MRRVFKQSSLWQNIAYIAIQTGNLAGSLLKCAQIASAMRPGPSRTA